MRGMEISKYWIMGGWKNLVINGWVRNNGGVDLKVGGGRGRSILSKVILVPQKILNKTLIFWPMLQKYSASAFQNWHKIHFLLHFHACSFSSNSFEWINSFIWFIYILSFKLFKNWSMWSKAVLNFFLFLGFEL